MDDFLCIYGYFCLVFWMIVYGSMHNFCEFMDDFVLIHGIFLVHLWMIFALFFG
jgi:hypothetical protein